MLKQYGKWYLNPKHFNQIMKAYEQDTIKYRREEESVQKEQLEQEKANFYLKNCPKK